MPELLTMQDLANGHLDVKALGEAANGDENTIVTTRTGNTYPSAERAINIMFKNGGLPATPFKTKALMTASALVDGDYAQVTDDTVNNGLYVKTVGAWVKSEYDPLTQAKADATTKANAAEANANDYTKVLISGALDFSENSLLLEQADFISGYLRDTGTISALAGFSYTSNFIPVNVFYQYVAEGSAGSSLGEAGTCFYDINQNFISGVRTSTLANGSKLTPPNGASYVRFCIKTTNTGLFNVRVSSKTLIDIEANIRNPLIYPVEADTLLTENRNPNGLTTAAISGANAIVQFAKQDFPFFLKSASVLMRARGEADIYLYKVNSATSVTKVKKVASLVNTKNEESNVTIEFGNGLFVPTGYFLAYQKTSGGFLFTRNTTENTSFVSFYTATQPPEEGESVTVAAGSFTSDFYIPMIIKYKKLQYSNMDRLAGDLAALRNKDIQLDEKITELNEIDNYTPTNVEPYVNVFQDWFRDLATQDKWTNNSNSWIIDSEKGTAKPTLIGGMIYSGGVQLTNTLTTNAFYFSNKRSIKVVVSFESDSVLELSIAKSFTYGLRILRVNFASKKLELIGSNGTTVLSSFPITIPMTVGKQYVIRMAIDGLKEDFTIMDYATGESNNFTASNTTAGNQQLGFYSLALASGEPFTVYEVAISIKNKPKVYIVGDSITAQDASGVEGWAYKLTQALGGNVVIAAQGSSNGTTVMPLIASEVNYIKPDILMWCHGHNGGLSDSILQQVKEACNAIGTKLYANHVTCSSNDNHIALNEIIERNGLTGCRFDIATARDSNPYKVAGDSAIRADSSLYKDISIHPNIAGSQKQWERFKIDLPELFY